MTTPNAPYSGGSPPNAPYGGGCRPSRLTTSNQTPLVCQTRPWGVLTKPNAKQTHPHGGADGMVVLWWLWARGGGDGYDDGGKDAAVVVVSVVGMGSGAWRRVSVGIGEIGLRGSFLKLAGKVRRKAFPAAAVWWRWWPEGGRRWRWEREVYESVCVFMIYGNENF
ncbi:hypothetical protein Tco_0867267 [Tanacetum coccineum]